MANRTITALFDRYDEAADAVRKLEAAGIPHSDISIVANNENERYSQHVRGDDRVGEDTETGAGTGATLGTLVGGGAGLLAGLGLLAIPGLGPVVAAGWLISTLTGAGIGAAAGGLIGALTGAGVSEADAHLYAEGVRRGGTLVTVRADESRVRQVADILDDHGSVDLDEREQSWRSEGWTGFTGTSGATTGRTDYGTTTARTDYTTGTTRTDTTSTTGRDLGEGVADTARSAGRAVSDAASSVATGAANLADKAFGTSTERTTSDRTATGYGATGSERLTTGREEAIPIVEEDLQVGKREVQKGRVRIHSYMTETPVQEQVNLREEHVQVERRPVDRPLADADQALFRERTIEATEKAEQAVVNKEARVKEELVVRKDVNERTETVSDTVRRTEVEVEDERGNRVSGTGTTGSSTDRNR